MEYEKKLKGDISYPADSDGSSGTDEEEEWGRWRKMLDKASDDDQRENNFVMQEAHALDKAMEDRIVARKSSASSMSSTGSRISVRAARRSRYTPCKRTESIASTRTNKSFLSEHLVEENEEQELLGIGGESDGDALQSSTTTSPDETEETDSATRFASIPDSLPTCPPFAPDWKVPPITPPMSAMHSTFQPPTRVPRQRKRPLSLSILPPVPSSLNLPLADELVTARPTSHGIMLPTRQRAGFRCPVPPLHLRNSVLRRASVGIVESISSTPSQTLFVFPPSPTLTTRTRTPSTMTLTSGTVPFPNMSTPRVSTFKSKGRTRSFIGFGSLPTPTVAFSKVDACGYVGFG
jgi:tyrosine-protein phosphatase